MADPLGIRLDGRIAIVTGASRGIGAATARMLAQAGAIVTVAARGADALQGLAAELGPHARAVPTDLTDDAQVERLIAGVRAEFGRLDILVNNAGILPRAQRAERIAAADWRAVLEANLTAPFNLACRAKELMTDGGVIVNLTSTASAYPSVGLAPYCVTKTGLDMLTRVLALEWARDGVRVVAVAPGKIDTIMLEPIAAYVEANDLALNALDRAGAPEEVAGLILYLVSDSAAYITGSTHVIDGGELLAPQNQAPRRDRAASR